MKQRRKSAQARQESKKLTRHNACKRRMSLHCWAVALMHLSFQSFHSVFLFLSLFLFHLSLFSSRSNISLALFLTWTLFGLRGKQREIERRASCLKKEEKKRLKGPPFEYWCGKVGSAWQQQGKSMQGGFADHTHSTLRAEQLKPSCRCTNSCQW